MTYNSPDIAIDRNQHYNQAIEEIAGHVCDLIKSLGTTNSAYVYALTQILPVLQNLQKDISHLHETPLSLTDLKTMLNELFRPLQQKINALKPIPKLHQNVEEAFRATVTNIKQSLTSLQYANIAIPRIIYTIETQKPSYAIASLLYRKHLFAPVDLHAINNAEYDNHYPALQLARRAHAESSIKLFRIENTEGVTRDNLEHCLTKIMDECCDFLLSESNHHMNGYKDDILTQWLKPAEDKDYLVLGFIDSYSSVISEQHWPDFVVIANKSSDEAETVWLNQPVATPSLRG